MLFATAIASFLTATACSLNSQVVAIRSDPIPDVSLERQAPLVCGAPIIEEPSSNARNIEYIIDIGFPVGRCPVDCI